MVDKTISWCVANRFPVFAGTVILALWGFWGIRQTPLDAVPDVSDVQIIVSTEWPGRSPDLVEAQVTYPIVTALVSTAKVRSVRGVTDFGISFVYIIFDDSTDLYWARSRVLEHLQTVRATLPDGVSPTLAPDATGVGWVFQYVLVDETRRYGLDELRSLQDWTIRFALASVPGVAEVASIGGFVKQYQVNLDPDRLSALNVSLKQVVDAIRASNNDVEGRLLEFAGREYMVRALGRLTSTADIEEVAIGADASGTPVRVRDVADVRIGPDIRRGVAELDGRGEVVGGIVIMRVGENALEVIRRVKQRVGDIQRTLPTGVSLIPVYDRSDLIQRSISTLRRMLIEAVIVISLVVIVFLSDLRAAFIPITTMFIAVLASFIPLAYLGVTTNIMSLGGIALAVGVLVDAAIVMVENGYRRVAEEVDASGSSRVAAVTSAAHQVGRAVFFSLAVIIVSFVPVFLLEAQEGRMFRPLALTKTFGMMAATLLSITMVPVLMVMLVGRTSTGVKRPNIVTRFCTALYEPVLRLALRRKWTTLIVTGAMIPLTALLLPTMGREFMPPLYEGSLLYMPTAPPGLSITEATRLLQTQDRVLRGFPEVERVFGTAGRATTATDNSPVGMVNTVITLKPRETWRPGLTFDALQAEMDEALRVPGLPNVWTQPIRNRLDMLFTGMKTPIGIKILGSDLAVIQRVGLQIEALLRTVPGTRSAYAERVSEGYFTDIRIDRGAIGRYGLTVQDVEEVIQTAIGGSNIGRTVEGRERYPINVRYQYDFRADLAALERVRVRTPTGVEVPLGQLAKVVLTTGPAMIRDENGLLAGYVYVDSATRDLGGYVRRARQAIDESLTLPAGYMLDWSGEYEFQRRASDRLRVIIPVVLFTIFILLQLAFRSAAEALIVMLSVVYAMTGGVILQWLLGYQFSVAVWVGYIALFGVAVQTGVIMVVYLHEALDQRLGSGAPITDEDVYEATMAGAVLRLRPKLMTVTATIMGLLPILWSSGVGSDVLKPIAAPIVGGMITSAIHVLIITPLIFYLMKRRALPAKELEPTAV
jgi:Cu(I)/Ag(I) efflux system membrane protein CusA/SilA